MKNPFLISGYVSPDYFCDREQETATIIRKLTNGNNMLLISPRRMGKTGLIDHCFYQEAMKNDYYLFYIDLYATNNLQEFVYKLGKGIFEKLKSRGRKVLESFFAVITSLRPAFRLDEKTGQPIFDIGISEIKSPEYSIEEIFKYLQNADKQCFVAIDEFQQIANYPQKNVEAILRTHIQKCTNVNFLFAGSQRHTLRNIFFSPSRPFYQSVSMLALEPIDKEIYVNFVSNNFEKYEKKIIREIIEKVYNVFEGHTFYIQSIFNEIFSLLDANEECTIELVNEALNTIIKTNETLFYDTLNLISQKQKEVLCAIAKEGKAKMLTSAEFVKRHGLSSPSSVQTAVRQLKEKNLVSTDKNNHFMVDDRFFGLWLTTQYGNGFRI